MRGETTELLLENLTKLLKLPTIRQQYRSLAREAEERNLSYEAYLLALLEQEQTVREANQRQQKLQRAAFPIRKTLDTFDFHLLPSLNRNRVMTLAQGEFVQKKENVLMLGNSGTGKTHLAIAIGMQMVQEGFRVRFITAANLVEELLVAKEEHRLLNMEKQWLKYDVVICDELGYVPFSRAGAELLFQFFSSRYERGSSILTSNLDFAEWTQVFGDEKLTAALLDRLTHRAHILMMNGDSHRFRQSLQRRAQEEHDA
ncbi:AAA family ATPase [Paenibacillus sp. JMULE4]|uniref:IS21-like element helper ATPase IstB n=1 Tax=Paenibacillus sp. JMULE4 TaxID=2518342 RepID=UPI0015776522|nr:IS21-like element helper ATPase IstB [Paenibacillus sp. JMULE4]NTZ16430.1 AAA family ATPase [Paenibacillus sp. JMULE4]NTZ19906.1 AAA family ATPase [Paenibacillus sp. JMULE4]